MSDNDDLFDLFGSDDDDPFGADDDSGGFDDDFDFDTDLESFEGESDLFEADDEFGDDFGFDNDYGDVAFDDDDEFAETGDGPSRTFILVAVVMIVILLAGFGLIVAIVLGGRGPSERELTATAIVQTNQAVEVALNLTNTQNAVVLNITQTADAFTDTPTPTHTPTHTPSPTPDTSLTQTAVFRETLDAANVNATTESSNATATFFARLTTEPNIVPGQDIGELEQTATAIAGGGVIVSTPSDADLTASALAINDTQQQIASLMMTQTALEQQVVALSQQLQAVPATQTPIQEQIIVIVAPQLTEIAQTQTALVATGGDDANLQLTQVAVTQAALETGAIFAPQLTEIAQTLQALQAQTDASSIAQLTAIPPTQVVAQQGNDLMLQFTPVAMTQQALINQNNSLALQLTAVVQQQLNLQVTAVAQSNVPAIQQTETAIALLGQGGGGEATPTREDGLPTARPTVSGNAVALTATALAEILNPPAVTPDIALATQVVVAVVPTDDQLPNTGLFDEVFAGNPAIIFGAALSLLGVIGLARVLRSQNRKRD